MKLSGFMTRFGGQKLTGSRSVSVWVVSSSNRVSFCVQGKQHRKRLKRKLVGGEEVEERLKVPLETAEAGQLTCELCSLTVPTQDSMKTHLAGACLGCVSRNSGGSYRQFESSAAQHSRVRRTFCIQGGFGLFFAIY